jgi:hypothetical protein
MQERGAYSKSLEDAATFLTEHFRGRPECATVFQELEDLDKSSIVAEPPPKASPHRTHTSTRTPSDRVAPERECDHRT